MIWIGILIDILQALPTLLPIIIEIWEAIYGQPVQKHQFQALLLKHQGVSSPTATPADLSAATADFTDFRDKYVLSLKKV